MTASDAACRPDPSARRQLGMSNQGSVPVVRQPPPEGCGTWATARRTQPCSGGPCCHVPRLPAPRSEEHTSELQSLMRISYAVFCLKTKNNNNMTHNPPKV